MQNASSAFGAFLDPVADKLMVATTLILLSTLPVPVGSLAGNTWILPVLTCGEKVLFIIVQDVRHCQHSLQVYKCAANADLGFEIVVVLLENLGLSLFPVCSNHW